MKSITRINSIQKFRILGFLMLGLVHIVIFNGCKKGNCNQIPDTRVMLTVSMVQYPELRIPFGSVSLDQGGIAGILVVNLGNNQFIAYERCSPVNPEKRCAVKLEDNGLTAIDPCSQARFILKNGAPASVSECPLKPYMATKQGETIVVTH